MTVSVCCLTSERPAKVATALAPLRSVADEILVAMDSRIDQRDFLPLFDVADRVLRFEYTGAPEHARPWLVAQCQHPAVLMIDGDEVPSAALVEALPSLVGDVGARQFRIARRWCFPDERHWLAERPWWPDFQRRLFRRDAELDFDLLFHSGVHAADPTRHVCEPLYHVNFLIRRLAERRHIARNYETHRPGLTAVGGGALNTVLYEPEHFATLRPQETPEEDAKLLRSVLDAPDIAAAASPDLPVATAAEIASHVPADGLDAQGYRAELGFVEPDRRTDPGTNTHLLVEIHNTGPLPIPRLDAPGVQVRLCTRVLDGAPGTPAQDWVGVPLPCDIPPGERRVVEAAVHAPTGPGRYRVEADLLNERGRWFGCSTRTELEVATRWGRYAL